MRSILISLALIVLFAGISCGQKNKTVSKKMTNSIQKEGLELATFGSGCFWCTEAVFQNVDGVEKVESGYTGGKVKNPTYKEVCSGLTGHAEVIRLTYDPQKVTYDELLEIFWKTHDPTTLNKQGNDEGPQYRSVIFYHNDQQKQLAESYKAKLTQEQVYDRPIVTEISPAVEFYVAEDYHQNYYNLNGNAPYCAYVIQPKVEKFKKVFKDKLKKE
ncbi:peptide-methionine (S)-S-oxide reductase MsrA [Chryseolinea sp. Jin1]|uniref:Peptide methionine sulfoxide reductase MsrA n=2 Tax=Chryseolinea lacunae TaxID=2801331 RepID=A0ABS1KY40_9BACT|nr:peptide-methionine (S)-S-oxide reductase MsrA [Chryseolinea lacunae]